MLTINDFRKSLIDEVLSKSNASSKDACNEVYNFSMTKGFMVAFEKWKKLTETHTVKQKGPRHIRDILRDVILDDQCMNERA